MDEDIPVNDLKLTEEQLKQMFKGEWLTIAPIAYGNYLKAGRGLMLIDMRKVLAIRGQMNLQMAYVPEADVDRLPQFNETSKRMVKTYDPEITVLFLFEFHGGQSVGMYMGSGHDDLPSPKEIYDDQNKGPVH